jgi:hypothetical protein
MFARCRKIHPTFAGIQRGTEMVFSTRETAVCLLCS